MKKKLINIDKKFVFDKAKYHFDSINKAGLDKEQAYIHTGLFFAWIIKNDLYSKLLLKENPIEIEQTKKEKILPSQIYMDWDGVLIGELLNQVGYNFTTDYFDFSNGDYAEDYSEILCANDPDIFRVKNTWDNYHKIAKTIDKRFIEWNKKN